MEKEIKGGEFFSPEDKDIKDIKDLIDNPFDLPLLSEYLGKKDKIDATLTSYSVDSGSFGEFAIMEFNGSGKYRCSSEAVVEQVKALLATCNGNPVPVKVHVAKKMNKTGQHYFSLLG